MNDLPDSVKGVRCEYCHCELKKSKWSSAWGECDEQHYKILSCEKCGKKNWLNVDFEGSGHDDAPCEQNSSIESIVKKVQGA